MSTTRLFKNGNSQAVRIPAELAYEVSDMELTIERVDLFVDGARHAARSIRERKRYEAEELRAHPALSHPREIDVTSQSGKGQGRLVRFVDVVADPSRPHECVGVEVDRWVLGMDRACGVGRERRGRHAPSLPTALRRRRACRDRDPRKTAPESRAASRSCSEDGA